MNPKGQIIAYLSTHRSTLASSVAGVVEDVKLFVFYRMSPLTDEEIRQIVVQWAMTNAVGLLTQQPNPDPGTPDPVPAKTNSNSEFMDAVQKAINITHDRPIIGDKDGNNISVGVTGLTANLQTLTGTAALGVSWTGKLSLDADSEPFHFSGVLAPDKWEVTLSFPRDTYVPDMTKFGDVFSKGVGALGKIADATRSFNNVQDSPKVAALIKPHAAAIADAVEGVMGIAKAPKKGGVSVGFKIGSPDPMPGGQGMPGGVQGEVVFTWWF